MNKWLTISLGAVLGISHIGMIGLLSNRESKLPSLDIPVGPYTSYLAEVSKEGYRISYKANDPKTMYITKDIKKKGGFLGLANNIEKVKLIAADQLNVFDILNANKLVIGQSAINKIQEVYAS